MAISDWELWARAAEAVRQKGDGALPHAVERLVALFDQGDMEGAQVWAAIARRIVDLQKGVAPDLQS